MIRGRRAHGAAQRHWRHAPTYHQTTKQGYTELALCLVNQDPKTLKMSAYGTLSPTARPQGSCQHRGRCPHPRSPRGRVQGKTSCTLTTGSVGSPPTCKGQAASGCFASLDRFPAPSASDRFATLTEVERGQGRRSRAFTLDALEPTQHFATGSGGWVLTACPCGATSEAGVWGKAPVLTQERPQCTVNACVYRKYRVAT